METGDTEMTKAQALAKWAEVYRKVLNVSGCAVLSLENAVAFGVEDMKNQTKGMSDEDAAFMILDDADWMRGKIPA